MSMKGCLIGNSHLAALASAAKAEGTRWPSLSFESFGAHGDVLDKYQVADGWYRSDDSAARKTVENLVGRDAFQIDDYDFFVLSGLRLSVFPAIRFFRAHATLDLPGVDGFEAALALETGLVSTAMMADMVRARLSGTRALAIAAQLRSVTQVPIFVVPQPRPATQLLDEGSKYKLFKDLKERGHAETVSGYFDAAAEACCAAQNVTYLPQPVATMSDGLFTASEFMVGSVRFAAKDGVAHDHDDVLHANAAYGRRVLDQVCAALT